MEAYLEKAEKEVNIQYLATKQLMWGQHFLAYNQIIQNVRDHHKDMTREILKLLPQSHQGDISRLIPLVRIKKDVLDIETNLRGDPVFVEVRGTHLTGG